MSPSSSSYGHAYLTSYGWTGAGTGLRDGAIDKPLAITQKKDLGGIGKDRDEAFPFWDHVFAAASKAISIKISDDDRDDDDDPQSLWRTTTGLLSNRRPTAGPHADPGPPRPSLLATAKREAAKRVLYARFFRGPVLGPNEPDLVPECSSRPSSPRPEKTKRRESEDSAETRDERRERKRLKKERRAAEKALANTTTRSCTAEDIVLATKKKKKKEEKKGKGKGKRRDTPT